MIRPDNLVRHELIGLHVQISDSKDESQAGTEGNVIDETQKTLVIRTEKGEKIAVKRDCVFDITLPDGTIVRVDGRMVYGRPEERIKRKLPKKWERPR